ncbi:McrB family protein [[Bacillus] enclensis]|uniref:McrB family protein n=1 Tax=[Bacillus] enclensis TaxID=1402860 RepID=UPI0018DB0CB8|nr:AAA family ATPase [[Bacillus] enclensis]MBH9966136.1 AAA family ATPase [[Bacillus] enclensis]
MLNLTHYQSLFDEDNTEVRCRRVLDEVAPHVKGIFERFIGSMDISLGEDYYIRSYDTTLTTTYHDSRNPAYAEKKKNSDIGRKYFVGLYKKAGEKEYNLLTLELNGIDHSVLIHTETSFIPFWSWVRSDVIGDVLSSIPNQYSIFTGWKEKSEVPLEELEMYVRNCIKPRKRPWFQVGKSRALEGQMNEEELIRYLQEVWEGLSKFRDYIIKEILIGQRALTALQRLSSIRDIEVTRLLGRQYTVEISSGEKHKSHGKRQSFQINDGDQMITKGHIDYLDYDDKNSPFQTIVVKVAGGNQIFTNVREILADGTKEWWIKKLFATHKMDNQEIKAEAMRLLQEHGIKVADTSYFVGTYDNDNETFVEGEHQVKKNFIDAALLFAHARKAVELPFDDEENDTDIDDGDAPDETETLEPNFRFAEIHDMIDNSQFTFSKTIVRDLHLNLTALDDKHFVILSGISGTGKTQLCRLYANAVYGLEYESDNPYFSIIPVRPDWTDSSSLFGYYSSFEKRYVKTEFLKVIMNALKEREKPHFILLDEMNLARVEYYLSDYLSAVESRKEIPLHQDEHVKDVPQKLSIPPNVYILGTINVDETTHSISDKVLDRAFVMTLSDVDFTTFWERVDQDMKDVLSHEFFLLKELHVSLAAHDLHFGYRTMGEMLQKLYANYQLGSEHAMDALESLDGVITEKVLTKIRGDERISDMLTELNRWLTMNLEGTSVSLQHVKRMQEELEYYGATQFWR